jgi:peptide/nickel transport system substrate-binding protein
MKFIKSLWLAGISVAMFALLRPAATPAAKHPRYGGTLRLELSTATVSLDPRTWKPGSVAAAESLKFAALVYDRLVTLDDYGRFQPALALEWSHDAAFKTWQFKLRPGVKFSDGVPLTPKEVASALQPLLPSGLQIAPIEGGVQIRAANPAPDLLDQLASGRYFIFRLRADNSFAGTGPFQLVESVLPAPAEANPSAMKPGRLKFRAREDAWSGRPFVDTIEVTLGDPPLREVLNLQVGRVDVIDIPPDLVRKARQDNLRVWSAPPDTLLALRWDDAQPAASDTRLREALDLSLDRDTMANVLLQRQALPATALLPQWLSGYAFLFGSSMNLDRAKALRASVPASAQGGEAVRLRVDAVGDLMKLLGERVAVNARQANISVQLVLHTSSLGTNAPAASTVGLHLFAWHYDSLSPRIELQALAQLMHADAEAKPEPGDELTNPEKLYAQERHLLGEREVLPLLLIPEYVGIAPNVRNWSADPSGAWRLADVWLEVPESATSSPEEAPKGRPPAPGVHP